MKGCDYGIPVSLPPPPRTAGTVGAVKRFLTTTPCRRLADGHRIAHVSVPRGSTRRRLRGFLVA